METPWKPLGNPCLGAFLEAQSHLRSARLRDEATPVVQPRHGHGEGQAAQAARHLRCTQHLEDLAGRDSLVSCHSYPLVNSHITMEISTIFNGKIHYFDWTIFNSYVTNYQRVGIEWDFFS